MHISNALQLKTGDSIYCPADRGEGGYRGRVTHGCGANQVYTTHSTSYIWIEVKEIRYPHRKAVWPSYRLSK